MSLGSCRRVFEYDLRGFSVCIAREKGMNHSFDEFLQTLWTRAMDCGLFRYKLSNIESKVLPGKYRLYAQLNAERALKRRKPQFISDVVQPFDPSIFNFTKVPSDEVLFELRPLHWLQCRDEPLTRNLLIMNVSPLEYCNTLIVPDIYRCLPQVLTFDSLRLAVEIMLLSRERTLRVGFNSLGGFASVNHLHFHLYYLNHNLFLETAAVKCLSNECYEISGFLAEGFVFQLLNSEVMYVVASVMKLVSFLVEKKIAHNLFITRGNSFHQNVSLCNDGSIRASFNAIRIYVWARDFSHGAKEDWAFNPALCELAGHLPIKTAEFYQNVTEDNVGAILKEVCHEEFVKVREDVRQLFS